MWSIFDKYFFNSTYTRVIFLAGQNRRKAGNLRLFWLGKCSFESVFKVTEIDFFFFLSMIYWKKILNTSKDDKPLSILGFEIKVEITFGWQSSKFSMFLCFIHFGQVHRIYRLGYFAKKKHFNQKQKTARNPKILTWRRIMFWLDHKTNIIKYNSISCPTWRNTKYTKPNHRQRLASKSGLENFQIFKV